VSVAVEIDLSSGVPPYEQIRLQVLAHVAAGRLVAGDRLPTIRDLATDLGVAAGTVQRAYRELEQAGVVETRRRTGTVVAEGRAPRPDEAVRAVATRLVATARAAGLDDEAVLALVRGALIGPLAD
jgi:GntR family transcriptional regulator